jgi:hypothetical protein
MFFWTTIVQVRTTTGCADGHEHLMFTLQLGSQWYFFHLIIHAHLARIWYSAALKLASLHHWDE